ncbi:GrpB family protein [Listeria rocourtiae]|uniref:GrpB family protein n=1 Tax=Listeria rocourtiae TaxID=647910 RepID=UPI0016299A64|nr:GrpB family protein [Listeria rocourtiae]MBC1603805.1 GrpB family protein [Listeria rocourtiae]
MIIKILEHDSNWAKMYSDEKVAIQQILQTELVASFHIGSTSVPNLKAKPIIDILLVVEDIVRLDTFAERFKELNYEVMGEFGMVGRRYYRKGGDQRTHQIHAFQVDNLTEIGRHLLFRDFLIAHPTISHKYGELKSHLADKYPNDIDAYCDGKDQFVKETEQKAIHWHWKNR